MKRILVLVGLCFTIGTAQAQYAKQIAKMYEANKYKEVVLVAGRLENFISGDDPKSISDLLGRSYYALRQYDSAIYFENKALNLDNDATYVSGWAYTYRGMAQYRLGNSDAAKQDLQKAIQLNKTANDVELAREFLTAINTNSVADDSCAYLFSQGAYKAAIENGRRQQMQREYKTVIELIGAAYFHLHQYDSATKYERRVLALDQDSTSASGWAHAYLGMSLFYKNQKDNGITELNKAIALNKTSNSVRKAENFLDQIINGRSIVIDSLHQEIKDKLNAKDYRTAANLALPFVATHPDDALGWDQLVTAYCWLHRYDSCLLAGKMALDADKEQTTLSCETHYHLGIALFMTNKKEAATDEFAKAINEHAGNGIKKKANHMRVLTGLDERFVGWKTKETDNLVFHFEKKKSVTDPEAFMQRYESEFQNAKKVLAGVPSKKIDVFVWENEAQARQALQNGIEVSLVNTDLAIIHTSQNSDKTSDVMHILGYWQKKM